MLRWIRNNEGLTALLFLLPSLAGFAVFFLIPFGMGFYYSLMDSPINGSFVGIANYRELLGNPIRGIVFFITSDDYKITHRDYCIVDPASK